MKILLIYPGHSHCTRDVAEGYDKALVALGHEVRPFLYHNLLVFYQAAIEHWREENPDFAPNPNAYLSMAAREVVHDVLDFVPDVALVVSGLAFRPEGYVPMKQLGVPVAVILTESPYCDETQAKMLGNMHLDLAFTNDNSSVGALESASGVRTVYLPHSYDPDVHRPFSVNGKHQSDVFFHGTLWPERQRLFAGVEGRAGCEIGGINPAIKTTDDVDASLLGIWDNAELAAYYNGTKIALNHHRTFIGTGEDDNERHINGGAYSLGPRAFEIAACGAFQLCDDTRPELREVFGDSVATYSGPDDLMGKIDYYLSNDAERAEMARAAMDAVQGCTFESRAEKIIVPTLEEVV